MAYPPINPEITRYTLWRWRTDVERWVQVLTRPTLEEIQARRDREPLSRASGSLTGELRITIDKTTRTEVA